MSRVIRAIQFSVFAGALHASGCATDQPKGRGGRDVHATARLTGEGPRMLVSGPALLMHVDLDGRDDLAVYKVARKDGTEKDCAGNRVGESRRLRAGVPNLVNLSVAATETACIAPATATRSSSITWHARRIDAGSGSALALDGADR